MKLPLTLSLALVFRAFPASLLASFALYPLMQAGLTELGVSVDYRLSFAILLMMLGWLVLVLGKPIYMLYEGRRYWPPPLRWLFLKLEKCRVHWIARKNEKALNKGDLRRHRELSVELRRFPMNSDGEYIAEFPTRLGNLMAAYEKYPKRVYGMDAIFYWYRIWLKLCKDDRDELDKQEAVAESVLYTSASLVLVGLFALIYVALQAAEERRPDLVSLTDPIVEVLPNSSWLIAIGASALVGSYLLYRIALHVHAEFGEFFKAIFDMHRGEVSIDSVIDAVARFSGADVRLPSDSRERFFIAWRYLHNFRVKTRDGLVSPTKLPDWKSPDEFEVRTTVKRADKE